MAEIVNGCWVNERHHEVRARDGASRNVRANSELDHLVGVLSSVVVASQNLSEPDMRRMTSFFLAAGDLMMSRRRLEPTDRKIFERELRAAVERGGGPDAA